MSSNQSELILKKCFIFLAIFSPLFADDLHFK